MRLTGARILVLVGITVTAAILLWTHQMRLHGDIHGLAPSFFFLFAFSDYSGAACAVSGHVGRDSGYRLSYRRVPFYGGPVPIQ